MDTLVHTTRVTWNSKHSCFHYISSSMGHQVVIWRIQLLFTCIHMVSLHIHWIMEHPNPSSSKYGESNSKASHPLNFIIAAQYISSLIIWTKATEKQAFNQIPPLYEHSDIKSEGLLGFSPLCLTLLQHWLAPSDTSALAAATQHTQKKSHRVHSNLDQWEKLQA